MADEHKSKRKESLQEIRKEQLLKEYEQELERIKKEKEEKPAPSEIKRELPNAADYIFDRDPDAEWESMSDDEKKDAIKGDMKRGWSSWGNLIMVAVIIGVIVLFKMFIL